MIHIFLCHASVDKPAIRTLYQRLVSDGMEPWFDEESLEGGENWREEIARAVRSTNVVAICLSTAALSQSSHFNKEIKLALDVADEQPEGSIFIIPVKLEETCSVPDRLSHLFPVNLFEEQGYARLLRALRKRAQSLGLSITTAATVPQSGKAPDERQRGAGRPVERHDTPQPTRPLSPADLNRLVELLLACPSIQDKSLRNDVVSLLPDRIRNAISRRDHPKADVLNIVKTCQNYKGGLEALVAGVRSFDEGSHPMQSVDDFWKRA